MTDLDVRPDPPEATFAARGHPVRWAWLGFLAVAGLASVAIWTGGVGPAVDLRRGTFAVVEDRGPDARGPDGFLDGTGHGWAREISRAVCGA